MILSVLMLIDKLIDKMKGWYAAMSSALFSTRGVVRNGVAILDGDSLESYNGSEFIITFLNREDEKKETNFKHKYSREFLESFGADRNSGMEIPEEPDFAQDSPRAQI